MNVRKLHEGKVFKTIENCFIVFFYIFFIYLFFLSVLDKSIIERFGCMEGSTIVGSRCFFLGGGGGVTKLSSRLP